MISFEVRRSQVTEHADVVFPVVPPAEKSGTFVNWEGRERAFGAVLSVPAAMPDLRALAALADELGTPLGFTTAAQAKAELDELAGWDGDRASAPNVGADLYLDDNSVRLASWRMLIDDSRANDGEPYLVATGRKAVARVSSATAAQAGVADGDVLTVRTAAGSVQLPVAVTDGMVDDVVWLPANSDGSHVRAALHADHGSSVTISGGEN